MSSSVFKEYPSSSGVDENLKIDSNLVIVVNKDGSVSVDQKTLHSLLANETTNTSVSVVRVSSPTPSIEEEIEQEQKFKKSMMNTSSDMESLSVTDSTIEEETPHVSLTVEGYYPPEEAKNFAAEVLSLAGLQNPLKIETIDYEFQKYVVQNDHCYTPLTSPSQRLPSKPQFSVGSSAQAELSKNKNQKTDATANEDSSVTTRKKMTKLSQQPSTSNSSKAKTRKSVASEKESDTNELDGNSMQGFLEDSDSDYSEESPTSSEDDHDSDLDFSVTPRNRKSIRKAGRRGNRAIIRSNKLAKKRQSLSSTTTTTNTNSTVTENDVENMLRDIEGAHSSRDTSANTHRKRLLKQSKKPIVNSTMKLSTPIVNKTVAQKVLVAKKETKTMNRFVPTTETQGATPTLSFSPVMMPSTSASLVETPIPTMIPKEITPPIIIKKDKKPPAHVEALFCDMTSLFTAPDIIKKVGPNVPIVTKTTSSEHNLPNLQQPTHNAQTHMIISPAVPTASTSNNKGFVQLSPAGMKNNKQHSAHISIQTHTSASEFVSSENDKRLDLIDSIVQHELKQNNNISMQNQQMCEDIPSIVKMLENHQNVDSLILNNVISINNSNNIKAPHENMMGLSDNNIMADDGLPEDLLQHVAELAENKELQEILDKQVLGVIHSSHNMNTSTSDSLNSSMLHDPLPLPAIPQSQHQPKPVVNARVSPPTISVKEQLMPRKEAIQIRRSDGRIITLPPIEAPATRGAKRRAQNSAQPSTQTTTPKVVQPKVIVATVPVIPPPIIVPETGTLLIDETQSCSRRSSLNRSVSESSSTKDVRSRKQGPTNPVTASAIQDDDIDSDESWNSEDDPDRLWCICKQPHNNRFMICCDSCEDWFHGKCVNITKAMGQQMEEDGIEWTCPNCLKKKQDKIIKQQTDFNVQNELKNTLNACATTSKPGGVVLSNITNCIVCKKPARNSSIYCSDDCIRQHAQNALVTAKSSTSMPNLKHDVNAQNEMGNNKAITISKSKHDTVIVFERKTNRCLAGKSAPTVENLKQWLQEHPTFEVVQQGSPQAIAIKAKQMQLKQLSKDLAARKVQDTSLAPQTPKIQTQLKISDQKKIVLVTPSPTQQNRSVPKLNALNQRTPGNVAPKIVPPSTATTSKTTPQKTIPVTMKPRKISTSDAKGPTTSKGHSGPEPIRVTVRNTLKEQLSIRMSEIIDKHAVKLSDAEIEQFSSDTEHEMFALFNKDTGTKYRAKYRSLMFNIKDRKNLSLFQKICDKSIQAKQLVKMSPDELASQELAQWRENENKHQLEMIKKSELDLLACAKSYVLKTHKGEEVIESKSNDRIQLDPTISVEDVVSVMNNSVVSSTSELETTTSPSKDIYRYDRTKDYDYSIYGKGFASSLLYSTSSTPTTTTTTTSSSSSGKKKETRRSRSRSHERSSRDRSKSSKHKRKHSRGRSRDRHSSREKDRHSSRDHKKEDRRSRERSREKEKKHEKKEKNQQKEKEITKIKIIINKDKDEPIRKSLDSKKTKKEIVIKPKLENFSLIDQILEASSMLSNKSDKVLDEKTDQNSLAKVEERSFKTSLIDQDQEPTSTVTIPTPPHSTAFENELMDFQEPIADFSEKTNPILWTGNIHMVDVATVEVSIKNVSGDFNEIIKSFPKEMDICGTIKPDIVWEYISQIKKSPNKEIVIIRLSSVEKSAYYTLYSHLNSRKRFSVVKPTSPMVKDFYIFPLPAERDYPAILLPIKGMGILEGDQKPDMLLGIIVKINGKRPSSSASKMSRKHKSSGRASMSSSQYAKIKKDMRYTPPASPKPSSEQNAMLKMENRSKLTIGLPQTSEESPNTSSTAHNEPQLIDDDDEPYSPGGSDDSNFADISEINSSNTTIDAHQSKLDHSADFETEKMKKEMDELNRKIAEEKVEIVGIISKADLKEEEIKKTLPSSLIDIAIPSNLSEILASIKNAGSAAAKLAAEASISLLAQNTVEDDEEYVPTAPGFNTNLSMGGYKQASAFSYTANVNHDVDDRIPLQNDVDNKFLPLVIAPPLQRVPESTSKLANLTEAELLSMVPDDALQPDTTRNKNNDDEEGVPPSKKSKWDDAKEPPPPGLEDEFNVI